MDLADEWDRQSETAFCHHDLNPGNILWSDKKITLIDWEYARLANPLFDLASISYYFDLTDIQLGRFLQSYTRHSYSEADIRIAEVMVKGLEQLWFQAANLSSQG